MFTLSAWKKGKNLQGVCQPRKRRIPRDAREALQPITDWIDKPDLG